MSSPTIKVLVINPNTSRNMTDALRPVVEGLGYENVTYSYFTSPSKIELDDGTTSANSKTNGVIEGVPSINSPADAAQSAKVCLKPLVEKHLANHDLFLVACYSQHPLVPQLQAEISKILASNTSSAASSPKYVTGIFEASVTFSLLLTGHVSKAGFGIVSTGKIWEKALQEAVDEFLGAKESSSFLGCETTGLNASELHSLDPAKVKIKMKEATKRLLKRGVDKGVDVKAICLGCAGMVGLEQAVREACIEELGKQLGNEVAIVDGVRAGVGQLIALKRAGV